MTQFEATWYFSLNRAAFIGSAIDFRTDCRGLPLVSRYNRLSIAAWSRVPLQRLAVLKSICSLAATYNPTSSQASKRS